MHSIHSKIVNIVVYNEKKVSRFSNNEKKSVKPPINTYREMSDISGNE
jgi:hypothetical protein